MTQPDKKSKRGRKAGQGRRKGGNSGGGGGGAATSPNAGAAASPAAAAAAAEPAKSIDDPPYDLGKMLLVQWGVDGSARLAQIVERARSRPEEEDPAKQWAYYVHFLDFNRRMDEWVPVDRILEPPSVAAELAKSHASAHGHGHGGNHGGGDKSASKDGAGADKGASGGEKRDASQLDGEGDGSAEEGHRQSRRKQSEGGNDTDPTVVADMEHDEHEGLDEASLKEHEEVTKVKNIRTVELGRHLMETWYFSPFPREYYPMGYVDCLYFCEFSLRFFSTKRELVRYQERGVDRHPPGDEIYRHNGLAMFEVDGVESKEYCQNLCYLAKLFLDHKTLYFDVDPFLFYVMCELDERGFHPVGYFSKEKYSDVGYNLACILTFPCHQRKGYGRFLISFSYELSKKEGKVGSPEKPLSDLGAVSYRSYWATEVLQVLRDYVGEAISIMDISKVTSIMSDDVVNTIQYLGLIKYTHGSYVLCVPEDTLNELLKKYPPKPAFVDPDKLHWAPLVTDIKGKDKWSIRSKRAETEPSTVLVAATRA